MTIELRLRAPLVSRYGERCGLIQETGMPFFITMIDWPKGFQLLCFWAGSVELLGPMPDRLTRKVLEFPYFVPARSLVTCQLHRYSSVPERAEVLVTAQEDANDASVHSRLKRLIEADPEQAALVLGGDDPDVRAVLDRRVEVPALPPARKKKGRWR